MKLKLDINMWDPHLLPHATSGVHGQRVSLPLWISATVILSCRHLTEFSGFFIPQAALLQGGEVALNGKFDPSPLWSQ